MKKLLTVLAALIVLIIIIAGVVLWITGEDEEPGPTPPPTETEAQQPDWCPSYEVLAAPGTWESAPSDDPVDPTFNPQSFMLSITQPIQGAYSPDDVKVWTLPYTAEFKNIQSMGEMSYDASREEGTDTLLQEMEKTHSECPQTPFILAGFSQGAVIMGDVASEIGNGRASIPAGNIAGVTLIADGVANRPSARSSATRWPASARRLRSIRSTPSFSRSSRRPPCVVPAPAASASWTAG